jgi:hypothetical protein
MSYHSVASASAEEPEVRALALLPSKIISAKELVVAQLIKINRILLQLVQF